MALTINQTHPPADLCLSEDYIKKILTIENTEGTAGETAYQLIHTDTNGKLSLDFFNHTSKKHAVTTGSAPYIVTIELQKPADQPDALLYGTIDRDILGTYNNYKGKLIAMTGNDELPDILKSSSTATQNRLVTTKPNSTKIDNNWLNGTTSNTDVSNYSSDNNKVVFTRDDSFIDPSLLNIQRYSVKLTANKTTYTIDTSKFTMPPNPEKQLFVYENGILLSPTYDYTVSGNVITFLEGVVTETVLQFVAIV